METKIFVVVTAAAALLCAGIRQTASAAPVTGGIGFIGTGSATTNAVASTLSFNNPMTADIRIGNYSAIPFGTPASFAPIAWVGSGTNAVLTSNNTPEWTINVGGTVYQYSIVSLQSASITPAAVSASGIGIATITGALTRDPTFLTFSIQGTLDAQGNASNLTFTMVAASGGPVLFVPDGGSAMLLLALAMIPLAMARWWHVKA